MAFRNVSRLFVVVGKKGSSPVSKEETGQNADHQSMHFRLNWGCDSNRAENNAALYGQTFTQLTVSL